MPQYGKIIAVCTSPQKQTKKTNVKIGILKKNHGLMGDAHCSAETHRHISLLAQESIQKMRNMGLDVKPGDFAKNLTTTNIDLTSLTIETHLKVGKEVILIVSQIGKKCHNRCAIYQEAGDCIMPREGIFTKVLKGGKVKVGDEINII
ncbi:MOSC domain-containing protein [Methanobacterium petrolearium]|uniref:MOSC domain-containing protein n=1 Tax=Methanobacterium petrolearium TaxID=710190 RepID=UPI001AE1002E|nr:MOSC domain-containing protein [Methanobacterium petrolearium]MBP1945279.1 MOSC domain-containing protein YiiM [Methanobacterium petrolearium]BDZ71230.1 molybdenum cofactor sulfurase [Methanobacterium petrolearium]